MDKTPEFRVITNEDAVLSFEQLGVEMGIVDENGVVTRIPTPEEAIKLAASIKRHPTSHGRAITATGIELHVVE